MKCSGVQITNHTTEIGCCDHMWDFNNLLSNFSFFYKVEIYFVEIYYISINDKMCHLKRYWQVLLRVTRI